MLKLGLHLCLYSTTNFLRLRNSHAEASFKISLRRFKLFTTSLLQFPKLNASGICSKQMVGRWLSKPKYLSDLIWYFLAGKSINLFIESLKLHKVLVVGLLFHCFSLKNYASTAVVTNRQVTSFTIKLDCT